jgi:hypothetical protein
MSEQQLEAKLRKVAQMSQGGAFMSEGGNVSGGAKHLSKNRLNSLMEGKNKYLEWKKKNVPQGTPREATSKMWINAQTDPEKKKKLQHKHNLKMEKKGLDEMFKDLSISGKKKFIAKRK